MNVIGWGYTLSSTAIEYDNGDQKYYRDPRLEKIWGLRNVDIGKCNEATINYVAGYTTKKLAEADGNPIQYLDPETGEYLEKEPPWFLSSRKPGFGHDYFYRFSDEMLRTGTLIHQGTEMPIPQYFWKLMEKEFPLEYQALKERQRQESSGRADQIDPDRRARLREFAEYQRKQTLKRKSL